MLVTAPVLYTVTAAIDLEWLLSERLQYLFFNLKK